MKITLEVPKATKAIVVTTIFENSRSDFLISTTNATTRDLKDGTIVTAKPEIPEMKNNDHKKRAFVDRFVKHFCCENHKRREIRAEKKLAKRQERRYQKQMTKEKNDD